MQVLGHQLWFKILTPTLIAVAMLIGVVWIIAGRVGLDLDSGWTMVATIATAVGGLAILISAPIAYFPYQSKYWMNYEKQGEITKLSNQFVSGDGDLSGRVYSIRFQDDELIYLSNDPRMSGFKVGDSIDLRCSYEFNYQAQDTISCTVRGY